MSKKLCFRLLAIALLLVPIVPLTASAAPIGPGAPTPLVPDNNRARLVRRGATAFLPTRAVKPGGSHVIRAPGNGVNRGIPSKARVHGALAPQQIPTILTPNVISTTNPASLVAVEGLNGYDNGYVIGSPGDLEPPDQGLCASPSYVIETINVVMRVYENRLANPSANMSLYRFFNVDPNAYFLADPRCLYDTDYQRFFMTITAIGATDSQVWIAVSQSNNPLLGWNLYSIDTTDAVPGKPGCPCFADQPLIGADAYGFFISSNEYSIAGFEFYGAQIYAVDKRALSFGNAPIVSLFDVGAMATPDGPGAIWYSVQPASATNGVNEMRNGGMEYFLSALDFFNLGDNRIAFWTMSGTSTLRGLNPTPALAYFVLPAEEYILPPLAAQKAGPIPLGSLVYHAGEQPIQTNDDRMQQVVYANGLLWSGLNTAAYVSAPVGASLHAAIAYWAVKPRWSTTGAFLGPVVKRQGYVSARNRDVLFPSIAVNSAGKGIIAFTLTGVNNYPSVAYAPVDAATGAREIHISHAGVGPQDGFTEYDDLGGPTWQPRWGDYSAAVSKPFNDKIYFASEYIAQTCTNAAYTLDKTCAATRTEFVNWSTGLGMVAP